MTNQETKHSILGKLFLDPETDKTIASFTTDRYYREELKQELFVILCKKKDSQLISLFEKKKIHGYIAGIIARMFNSKTHDFSKKIKKPRQVTIDHIDKAGNDLLETFEDPTDNYHKLLENTIKEVGKLSEPDRIIFDFMLAGLTIKAISQETGINRSYISEMITRIRTDLKKNIRKDL
jgi:DNA-directed RNA polymerase specialized sigma subunit